MLTDGTSQNDLTSCFDPFSGSCREHILGKNGSKLPKNRFPPNIAQWKVEFIKQLQRQPKRSISLMGRARYYYPCHVIHDPDPILFSLAVHHNNKSLCKRETPGNITFREKVEQSGANLFSAHFWAVWSLASMHCQCLILVEAVSLKTTQDHTGPHRTS